MNYCNSFVDEQYYLQPLLIIVQDALLYENLWTIYGILCPTSQAICIFCGLLEDEKK